MRFAAVQFDIVWEDKAANHAIIEKMLREAASGGGGDAIGAGTVVLLPELGDTGFSMNLDRIVDDRTLPWASTLAKNLGVFVQAGFARRSDDGRGRNCAAIVSPQGKTLGEYQKVHPFSYGKEAQHYSGGHELLLARCADAIVCPMICYDLRFPELWRIAAINGAEVFTIGASWPAARQHHWRALIIARAIENQAYVVAVNRVGSDPHLRYAGGSIIVSPKGEVIAEANDSPIVIHADLDLQSLRAWRDEFPALRDVHENLLGSIAANRADALPAATQTIGKRQR